MIRFLYIIALTLVSLNMAAQIEEPDQQQPVDTTKLSINAWQLSDFYTKTIPASIDTALTKMQIYNPLYRQVKSATFTGNLGDPAVSNIFYKRSEFESPHFISPYRWYLRDPQEIKYVNTTKPFTEFGYSFVPGMRDKDEQTALIRHTQNINPKLNIGFRYDYINARGQYKRQRNTIGQATFFGSYRGARYEFHGNINIGKITNQQNGGIPDSIFLDTEVGDTKDYPVNLDNASTELKERSFLLSQKLYFGTSQASEEDTLGFQRDDAFAFISHAFEGNFYKRSFTDDLGEGLTSDRSFYDTTYFNNNNTNDSLYYHSLKSIFTLELFEKKKYFLPVGLNVGIENELQKNYSSTQDTSNAYVIGRKNTFLNSAFIANAYHQTGEYLNWKAKGGLYFTGRKADDYYLNGNIDTKIPIQGNVFHLNASADLSKTTPGYFYDNLISNHFVWENNFSDITKLKLSASLSNKQYKLSVGVHSVNIDNYIFFGKNAKPEQTSIPVSILALYLKKRFDVWKFVWDNNVHYQVSDRNEIVSIPALSAYSSLYFDHVIRFNFTNGAIYFQIGADMYYNTSYYAYKFMPAFEQYYIQDVTKIGDYVYIDPFLNVQIKRTRVYLKYENVGAFFMEKKYYSAINHPRNLGVLKFGIFWTFYD